jgi:hypothetical protein
MVDGTRIHRVIGKDSEGVTRTQCEEFIERSKSEARAGRLSLPKGRKLALGFGAAGDNYIKRLEDGARTNIAIKTPAAPHLPKAVLRRHAARRDHQLYGRSV